MKQEKAKKVKVKTKLKKNAVPFWTSGEAEQNNASLFMNLSIRFALLCSATAGVSLLLIQIYKIPVNTAPVIFWAVCSSLFFNAVFVYVRFRYAFILFAVIFYIYQRVEDVLFNLGCLGDFLLIAIHGGILHTAGFASRPDFIVNELLTYNFPEALEFQTGLQNGVILVTVILALVFALSARGKFIGSILIACTIVLIPAIASQKATYVPALTLLAASMLGLYSVWASHEQSILKAMKRRKQKTGPFIPRVHKHSVNGALTACIALIAAGIAQSIIPVEKTRDVIDYFSDRSDQIIEWAYRIGERFEGGVFSTIPTLEHSGYMPGGGINPSGGLSINNPTTSRQPVLNVTLENNDAPVYLRNGIGAAFNPVRGEWNVNSRFDNMNLFPDNFYPEHEYLVFRQKAAQAFGYNANRLIGRQWVEIEYLVRSPHVMLPTLPHMPDYKSDSRFTWSHDSILRKRGSQRPQTYHWDILYPKPSHELGTALDRIQTYISNQRALMYGESSAYGVTDARGDYIHLEFSGEDMPPTGALRIFVEEYGLTSAEYLSLLEEYEEMVYDVYTQTVPGESENMQQLMRNAFAPYIVNVIVNPVLDARAIYTIDEDDIAYASVSGRFSDFEKASVLANYLKTEYTYSLITDNNLGDNTLLGNFLFETREGHCALFATAMTLALREEGIPARFVTGYVVGSGVPEAVNAGYRYTILARDLHAWVEVYFKGVGWVPFDPTPPIYEYNFLEAERVFQGISPPETTPRTTPRETPPTTPPTTPATTPATPDTLPDTHEQPKPPEIPEPGVIRATLPIQLLYVVVVIVLTGVLVLSVVMFIKAVKTTEKKRLSKYAALKHDDDRNTAREAYRFILRLLKIAGLSGEAGETPVMFAYRVDEESKPQAANYGLTSVIRTIEKLEFSKEELSRAEYERLADCTAELYRQIVLENRAVKRFLRRLIALNIIR